MTRTLAVHDLPRTWGQERAADHPHATLARIRTQEVVVLGQDTTMLHYGTTYGQFSQWRIRGIWETIWAGLEQPYSPG